MKLNYEPIPNIPDGCVVRLSGNLEVNGATQLWDDVSNRAGEEARFFIFDFSDVHIITSAGIGTLVRLFVRLRGIGGGIAIFGCSDKICEVFEIVMLRDILQVCDSEEEAWARLI
ncbi:MAG: STAS domain-containing protein [Thermoanaerobaculales bacterium]|nr:STAS domain-containing protein [Thermoanaerobaculales bacterium]